MFNFQGFSFVSISVFYQEYYFCNQKKKALVKKKNYLNQCLWLGFNSIKMLQAAVGTCEDTGDTEPSWK